MGFFLFFRMNGWSRFVGGVVFATPKNWKQYKKRHIKQLIINHLENGAAGRDVLQY
jgi:hypothetical protein